MNAATEHTYRRGINPLHGVLLAGTFVLFLGATLSDYAYMASYQIQWATFSSWLIAFALVCNGLAFLCGLFGLFVAHDRRRGLIYLALLVISFLLGFVNALTHAKDAWAMMPNGFILSLVVTVLALVATWIGFTNTGVRKSQ
ncbi:DUF2231 domain-containing protein [Kushneria konosiri]|uniref:DUF2231 domain-containing protein n=1 Tax=Kushneria konosiri TaxID=698828 RepID=A0A2Z2H7G6_9GAMM|nr:DUF2231 domain-containing protein [Kushneria konosiri]ARS53365.1 hypothetical protein B9G99_11260 [Kushneria konosiri]